MIGKVKSKLRSLLSESMYNKIVIPRHYAESAMANVRHVFPAQGMRVIGITGTNGKTTTANMIAAILTEAGYKVGLLSTATMQMGGAILENDTHLTTASGWKLQGLIAKMRAKGCNTLVLEVSSHALVQGRAFGVPIDVAVMTNLTQDHLDYHGTMENYANAKARLFKRATKLSVLNIDDKYFSTFERASRPKIVTYGQAQLADVRLTKTDLRPDSATFTVESNDEKAVFRTNQTGLFNVYNAMAAIAVARFYDVEDVIIQNGLLKLKAVPGRMEFIREGQQFNVVVDHAHTPDALSKIFAELKKLTQKRLIIVFGCTGDRDRAKRPIIGKLCATEGDVIYLTEDENYTEPYDKIRDMVVEGIKAVPKDKRAKFNEIADRRLAIRAAFKEAKAGDIVVLVGMGNQDNRTMNDGKIAWDEREVAREEIAKLKG